MKLWRREAAKRNQEDTRDYQERGIIRKNQRLKHRGRKYRDEMSNLSVWSVGMYPLLTALFMKAGLPVNEGAVV